MEGVIKKPLKIISLEKRLMLDASLGGLISSVVLPEDTANSAEQIIDDDVSVTGSSTDFSSDSLIITTTGGAEDQLSVNNEGTGAGQIGVSGTDITYEGTIIGSLISDGSNGSNLQIDLNANATKAGIERLIENITYRNTSDSPTVSRTINISLGAEFSENVTITVAPENDAPVTTTNTGITLNEGATIPITNTHLNVTDADNVSTDIVYNIVTSPLNGQLELTSNPGVAVTSFTQDDVNNNRVIYVHNDSDTMADAFDFTVTDGDASIAADTFNITITPVDDIPTITTNTGTTVSLGFSTTLGAEKTNFGSEVHRESGVGTFDSIQGFIDNQDTQIRLVFTTPSSFPNAVPGEVLFDSGGSGRGIGLYLNSNNELAWHIGNATSTPRVLSPDALATNTQYAVVLEIDSTNDQLRMHYEQSGNFNWFYQGRAAEANLSNFTQTDYDGGDGGGLGVRGGNSYGGYTGSVTGIRDFQGTIDSDLIITEIPTTTNLNTKLVTTDPDDASSDIIYTITGNVSDGTITRAGVVLGLGDIFTQADLDGGLVEYNSLTDPGAPSTDILSFSVFDGFTTLNDTFVITVDTVNTAPIIYETVNVSTEDFEGGASGWNNNTTTNDAVLSEFLGRFNRNVHTADNQEIFKTYNLSGTQDYVTIDFDFFEIDSWDNEYFYIYIDDVRVSTDRLRWNVYESPADKTTVDGINVQITELTNDEGYAVFREDIRDQFYHYSLTIPTTSSTIKFGVGTSLNGTDFNDESFGIDNIVVNELRTTTGSAREINIAETIRNGETIGTVLVAEPDVGQSLTYAITGGTGTSAFQIDTNTGEITVSDESLIDFESGNTSFTLDVLVTDNGPGLLSDTQTMTINILDALENTRPNINNQSFSIAEDVTNGTSVGTVTFTDAEGDGIERWQIIGGNDKGIFQINQTTGEITIANNAEINFENDPVHAIRFRAWDDNTLGLFHDRTLNIHITDVDDAPTLDREFIGENLGNVIYSSATGNFYQYVDSATNFANATATAESTTLNGVNGRLLTVESVAEKAFINSISFNHVWLGISDAANEGQWVYTAGENTGLQLWEGRGSNNGGFATNGFFTDWRGNDEPNNGTNNNGAIFYNNDGRWVDVPLTNNYRYVIEWDGTDIANNDTYYINHSAPDASDVGVNDSVGFVRGLDPEGDSLIYSIESGNDDGIFQINPSTGEITIASTANLDASVLDTYTLTVRVTEANGLNQFDEAPITIIFNDEITISANAPHNATEGQTTIITTAQLNVTLGDNIASDILFDVDTFPTNGQLQLSTNPGVGIIEFTLDDLQNNRVQYVHDVTETTTDSFTFIVTDGGQTLPLTTFNINIDPVNDAPIINVNTGATIDEGGSVVITDTMLDSLDIDDAPADLTYTASGYVRGSIRVGGVTQNTFTQADIDNGVVEFVHDGNEGGTASFDISLADGGEDSASPDTGTFTLTVTPVNDSPTITTNTGFSVIEGGTTTITNSILNATDPDDSGANLTYDLSNITGGQIQLTTNLGIPALSFTQGDLDANRVVFIHDGGEQNASFDVTLSDGGEDSATTDTVTVNATRIPVNDSPVISRNLGSSLNEGGITILKTAVLDSTDPDDSGTGLTYNVSNFVNGQVELLSNPNVAVTSFTQADLEASQVVFRHSGANLPTASFDISLIDGGEDSSVADTGTFNFTVDNTNDAPTITTNAAGSILEGGSSIITTAILDSFDPDDFGVDLTYTITSPVNGYVAFTSDTSTPITSFTQADLDNGIVTFIHDGSETSIATFDVELADGGEDSAPTDTATVTLNVTPQNDSATLVVNDGSPNLINFNDYSVDPFGGLQDGQGGDPTTFTISPDGSELTLSGNAWKKIDIAYTLTPNTVLSFEFRTDNAAELYGIGFDNDQNYANGISGYQLSGTDVWGGMDQSYRTYNLGDGWVRFDIPVGSDYTGPITEMVFLADKDNGAATAEGHWRNVGFYESNVALSVTEGGTFNITSAHINSIDPDDSGIELTYTASNIENGHIEVSGSTQTSFTQDDIDNNRVVFVHDGTDTLSAGFDISLADGLEHGATADTGSFSLIVTPTNDAANLAANTTLSAVEGQSTALSTAHINITDRDNIPRDIILNVTNGSSHGYLALVSAPSSPITSFTFADIRNGRVVYVHDGSENFTDGFDFTITDGGHTSGTHNFDITIAARNDGVSITTNTGTTLDEAATVTITSTMLDITDPDDVDTDVTYTASGLGNGIIQVNGVTQNTFTQDDINNGRVTFIHDGSETTSAGFNISVIDGGEHGAVADTGTFNMTILPVNDDPHGINLSVNTIAENESIGSTVGILSTDDVDLPGDNFTYSIMADPNGKFAIIDNRLVLNATLDFDIADSHSVMIRTSDGNGGVMDRTFTINVEEFIDTTVTGGPTDPNFKGDIKSRLLEEERDRSNETRSILSNFLSGKESQQLSGFYGEASLGQIIRQNTTFTIQDMLNAKQANIKSDSIFEQLNTNTSDTDVTNEDAVRFTKMADFLKSTMEFGGEDNNARLDETAEETRTKNNEEKPSIKTIDVELENILSYHEQRAKRLHDALVQLEAQNNNAQQTTS
jgi:hypothetical protein